MTKILMIIQLIINKIKNPRELKKPANLSLSPSMDMITMIPTEPILRLIPKDQNFKIFPITNPKIEYNYVDDKVKFQPDYCPCNQYRNQYRPIRVFISQLLVCLIFSKRYGLRNIKFLVEMVGLSDNLKKENHNDILDHIVQQ